MLVGGVALLVWNTFQRLGRTRASRRWARGHPDFGQRSVLILWPLIGVGLLLAASLDVAEGAARTAAGLLLLATLMLWLAFAVLPVPVPRFVQPRWYREQQPGSPARTRP